MDEKVPLPTKVEDMPVVDKLIISLSLKYTQATQSEKERLQKALTVAINKVLEQDLYKIVETWQID
ncbi:hypothetical protein LCGC14_0195230 [marine sediment metagenome]|uniref:Uncharacterized protein n=1 Tax=marine sediment metagenome TaxID=412755 RepID=A0A0F9UKA4_9ZZZZ